MNIFCHNKSEHVYQTNGMTESKFSPWLECIFCVFFADFQFTFADLSLSFLSCVIDPDPLLWVSDPRIRPWNNDESVVKCYVQDPNEALKKIANEFGSGTESGLDLEKQSYKVQILGKLNIIWGEVGFSNTFQYVPSIWWVSGKSRAAC